MSFAAKCTCSYAMGGFCNGSIKECRNKMPEFKIYKPLSSLGENYEDCVKIFIFITEDQEFGIEVSLRDSFIAISGTKKGVWVYIFISLTGSIEHLISFDKFQSDITSEPIKNIFTLVDFIRELGYEPQAS